RKTKGRRRAAMRRRARLATSVATTATASTTFIRITLPLLTPRVLFVRQTRSAKAAPRVPASQLSIEIPVLFRKPGRLQSRAVLPPSPLWRDDAHRPPSPCSQSHPGRAAVAVPPRRSPVRHNREARRDRNPLTCGP